MPLGGEPVSFGLAHIPLGGSTCLYAIELDLIKHSIWF
jgi:hypothetical protein